jgi:hypothetical protein
MGYVTHNNNTYLNRMHLDELAVLVVVCKVGIAVWPCGRHYWSRGQTHRVFTTN